MKRAKFIVTAAFVAATVSACFLLDKRPYSIAESKSYEASLFRQNCAICHGPEGEGKSVANGLQVPSLRKGEFKAVTEAAVYNQISNGGTGMLPFRNQLTHREIQLLTDLVIHDLRGQ